MSSSSSSSSKVITLKSSNGRIFYIPEVVAVQSQTINQMIQAGCAGSAIPLPNVTGDTLALVIQFCEKHVGPANEELKAWGADFVKVDQGTLLDLILAANYLEIKSLLDLTCQRVADMIKGKTPEEIRRTFNIVNDFTPEEEEQLRRENQWAFE